MAKRTSALPVFFDPSGKRWLLTRWSVVIATVGFVLLAGWLAPQQLAPLWTNKANNEPAYPQEVVSVDDTLPVISDGYVFTRIAQVQRQGESVRLVDPFSQAVFRDVKNEENAVIGAHNFVQYRFGSVPDHQLLLTFDDGPDVRITPALLDLLSRNKVPATFFTIGQNVVNNSELFERIAREGHVIGNHTLTHIDFDDHSTFRNREELIATDHVQRQVGNYESRLFRLPYGDEDKNILGILQAQQLGYLQAGFDLDTNDWQYGPDQTVPLPPLDGAGHVVLMHDGGGDHRATLSLTQRMIDAARAQGYTFTTFAAITPPEYIPHVAKPAAADYVTWAGLWAVIVLPNKLVGWLTWFGVTAVLCISTMRIVLALVNYRRQSSQVAVKRYRPFVSIVIAAFNEEVVIAKTLTALSATYYPRFEVIVVNDGSTDDTLGILRDFASIWPVLTVINQSNQGKSAALNAGIAVARGRYVVTLDADTVFLPNTIERLMRPFDKPNVGAVAGHIKVGNRCNLLTRWQSLEYLSGICVTRMAEGMLGAIMVAPGACTAWRKSAILAVGGYPADTLAEDSDLTIAIQRRGWHVTQVNAAVAFTEAPTTIRSLAKQRLRWTFGNFQVWFKHWDILFRPRYGWLGVFVMPYTLMTVVLSLLFMPLVYLTAAMSLLSGNWQSIALFALFVAAVHFVMSFIAVCMTRERAWHLLLVPIYRFIYEPLWCYLLYMSAWKAIRGRAVGWYSPRRTNGVNV